MAHAAAGTYSLEHTTTTPLTAIDLATAPVTTQNFVLAASVQVPGDWKRGTLLGTIAHDMNVLLLARANSGEPYTRVANLGFGTLAPNNALTSFPAEARNASQLPSFKRLDLRIGKSLRTAGRDWSLYLDARNLLNISNLVALFAETGDTANLRHRQQTIGDPHVGSAEYAALWNEANTAGALAADTSVDLSGCASWGRPADCVALTRVERRFGNGDRVFTLAEQQTTFNAFYHDFFGAWRFYAPGRTIRIGMELAL